jgi:DNA-directed RNA polymerase delta subunit
MLQSFHHLSDVEFENLPDNIRDALGTNDSAIKADISVNGYNLEFYETGTIDTTFVVVHDQKVIMRNSEPATNDPGRQTATTTLLRAIRDSLAVEDDASQEECFRRAHEFIGPDAFG